MFIFRYDLMIKCWREDPHERPEFIELVKIIEDMLGVGLDYLDLSCLTSVTNQEYFMNPDSSSAPNIMTVKGVLVI